MVRITSTNLTKRFEDVTALDHVSLEIRDGELFTLLGPSGCGKTTFLRCVAGFEHPDEGSILFDDDEITEKPPYERDTGMVFQNYALWPHMSVFDNITYGLKMHKVPEDERKERVRDVLELVHMEGMGDRSPHQLSGGQQQRVALARALVVNPKVLLLDEPLSNLDAKLRVEMRAEVKRIQAELGITTIYVTHDQEEAMSIGDRMAVLSQGHLEQVGTPSEIYFNPQSPFIADFIGQCTFLEGEVVAVDDYLKVHLREGKEVTAVPSNNTFEPQPGQRVLIAMRPESFKIGERQNGNTFEAEVFHVSFLGNTQRIMATHDGEKLIIETEPNSVFKTGDRITANVDPEHTLAIEATPEQVVTSN